MKTLQEGTLSEQEIKNVTFRYLKGYYRNRLRDGDTAMSADVRGKGGIVADGFITYRKIGGTQFVATFEATSFDTREEVRFTLRRDMLFWDTLVFALWGTAIGGGINISQQWIPIKTYGPLLPLVMLAAVFTALFFAFRIMASNLRRYRQVYAIEQFKQYHADEQWVSVGENVFWGIHDPHFEELRRQCIHFGFGLMVIDLNQQPHIHITPSREDVFDGRRRVVQLVSQIQFMQKLQDFVGQAWIRKFYGKITGAFSSANPAWINRFGGRHPRYWVAAAAALMLIGAIWYREYDAWRYRTVIPKVYAEEVTQQARKFPKEPPGYRLDTPLFQPAPFLDDRISYLDEWIEDRLAEKKAQRGELRNAVGRQDGEGVILYDCERFRNFNGVKFILLDAVYPDFQSALFRVEELQMESVQAGSLWLGCFDNRTAEFAVYIGPIFNTTQEAQRLAKTLERLRSDRSSKDFLTVKAIKN